MTNSMIKMNAEETKVGHYQIILLFIFAINYVIVAMSHAIPIFHNYTPKFYCESSNNGTTNRTYGCASSYSLANASLMGSRTSGQDDDDDDAATSSCPNGYTWLLDNMERSVVTDWNLICDKSYLINLGPTIYYVGVSIGAWVAGVLADRIGRLPVLAICLYTQGTMAVATYIVQSYPAFLGLRGLQGVFAQGLQNSTYILTLELFPTRFRTIVAMIMQIGWALGLVILATLSYFIPDWRILQLAVSVPTAVTVVYIWIIPESPRWLIAKGRTTEADITLEKIVKYNTCCSVKSRRDLVTEADNSANSTPAKPQRKSRLLNQVDVTKEAAKGDVAESTTLLLLLTPPNPVQPKSRRTSVRALGENLDKRLSNGDSYNNTEIPFRVKDSGLVDKSVEALIITNGNCDESSVSVISEKNNEPEKPENEEILTITTSSPEVTVGQTINTKSNIDQVLEIDATVVCNTTRNRYLTKHLTVMAYQWFTAAVTQSVVLGISWDLSNDRHASLAICGCLEVVIYVLTYFVLTRHGRRLPMSVCQLFAGCVCITVGILAVLPHYTIFWTGPAMTVLLVIEKATTASLVAIGYLFTVEIFPTVIRGACLGLCAISGMLGCLSAPHILSLKNHTTLAAPLTIVGCLCLLSGLICLILPETQNVALPDTVQKMERKSTRNKVGVERCDYEKPEAEEKTSDREILREKLFSEDWVDAGNGIIVNFSDNKN